MHLGSHRFWTVAALAAAVVLPGCANVDLGPDTKWFAKPIDFFGRSGGYTFSEMKEARRAGPITANDLVQANGSCPAPAHPAAAAAAVPAGDVAAPPDATGLLGGGIALGMSECEVVYRAGAPNAVQIGKSPNGERTAVLTFNGGPRPGIYHFEGGRLMDMDRVAEPAATPEQAKKKRPTKSAKKDNQA